jgi:hypothetical protein
MNLIEIFKSWFARSVKKVDVMIDENGQEVLDVQPAPEVAAAAPDVTAVLEGILKSLGHKLPEYWAEAVALAKKAL